jgi:osomolarity two-component system response regulator SKN7
VEALKFMALVEDLISKLLRPPRILFVEDDTVTGNAFVMLLSQGYDCDLDWANDADRAIEFLSKKSYDIVFLNLVLPKKSGVEVLRYVKENKPALPVIVVTANVDSNFLVEVASLGVVGVISKPFTALNFEDVFRTYGIRTLSKQDSVLLDRTIAPMPA